MTIDEEAAKVVAEIDQLARAFDSYEFGLSVTPEERQKYIAVVLTFGRRCAEAMREECENVRPPRSTGNPPEGRWGGWYQVGWDDGVGAYSDAIRQVSVEEK